MKIVMFGNTNNYPLRLAQAFQKLGHDVHLIVDRKELLHRPEAMHPEYADGYPEWMHDVSDLDEEDYIAPSMRIARVLNMLEDCDAAILNGLGPSLLPLLSGASAPARVISFLTGSDLDYYANYKTISARQSGYCKEYIRSASAQLGCRLWSGFIQRQRQGILQSDWVSYFPEGAIPASDTLFEEIGVDNKRRMFIYMCGDVPRDVVAIPDNKIPRIFCGSRLTWKKPIHPGGSPLDYKGGDVMVRGLAKFVRQTGMQLDIHLFEKGLHVEETKQIVHESGLDAHVTWLQEMPLHQFHQEMKMADICFEQLGETCIGMVGLDAMVMGKPVIANARPDIWRNHLDEEWPICHAVTSEDVYNQLTRLLGDAKYRKNVGKRSRSFVVRHFSPKANARMCLKKLDLA